MIRCSQLSKVAPCQRWHFLVMLAHQEDYSRNLTAGPTRRRGKGGHARVVARSCPNGMSIPGFWCVKSAPQTTFSHGHGRMMKESYYLRRAENRLKAMRLRAQLPLLLVDGDESSHHNGSILEAKTISPEHQAWHIWRPLV